MTRLIVATRNSGKAAEIRAVLAPLPGWEVEALPEDAPEAEETGATFLANAIHKTCFYGALYGGWTVADDSGLEVDALGGRPGVYSARYANTDQARNVKLLGELADVPDPKRGARFVCALALARDGHLVWSVVEQVGGRIARTPAGTNGFGYDPLFSLGESGATLASLEPAHKNRISHRGRALARLLTCLRSLLPPS
jgi:XTP/dITP diphosphohydrolase